MLLLGHMGIGAGVTRRWAHDLSRGWLLFGTVLPDLIDKPLFYFGLWFPKTCPAVAEFFTSTRAIGHSGFLLALLLIYAVATGSRRAVALLLGMLTHVVLDLAGDGLELYDQSATMLSLVFPFLGFHFAPRSMSPASMADHLNRTLNSTYKIGGEVVGAIILVKLTLDWRAERKLSVRQPAA